MHIGRATRITAQQPVNQIRLPVIDVKITFMAGNHNLIRLLKILTGHKIVRNLGR